MDFWQSLGVKPRISLFFKVRPTLFFDLGNKKTFSVKKKTAKPPLRSSKTSKKAQSSARGI